MIKYAFGFACLLYILTFVAACQDQRDCERSGGVLVRSAIWFVCIEKHSPLR